MIALGLGALPLVAFMLLSLLGKRMPRQGDWLGILTIGLSFILALYLFMQIWGKKVIHVSFLWFKLGSPENMLASFTAGIYLDNLAVLMLVVVTFISLLVQIFSVVYMHGDKRYSYYFGYLGLFTFSMLGIILADNLLLLFIFWELVGFSSYLLISFWYERDTATQAGNKAFLFNRVGDIGFLLGIFTLYALFQTFDLQTLNSFLKEINQVGDNFVFRLPTKLPLSSVVEVPRWLLTLGGIGLFCGCIGKSAQFPLQVWLPDAMAGPTPVSALIHAATMVAAGVYLLARCFSFFTPEVLIFMAIVGTLTTVLGAIAACAQYDIKKILAFSTISQLGYMVMGMGVGAYDASLLHLVTHAFFKASLFLNAGIIIHAMHQAQTLAGVHTDEQDIQNMGGFYKILPLTFYAYLPATAALIGLPLFSGFLSKDAILSGAWAWANFQGSKGNYFFYLVPVVGFASVLLTGFYMARHCFYIFFGQSRLRTEISVFRDSPQKEASGLLLIPVLLLAVLSLAFFFSQNPFHYTNSWVIQGLSRLQLPFATTSITAGSIEKVSLLLYQSSYIGIGTAVGSVLLGCLGIFLAWMSYKSFIQKGLIQEVLPANTFSKLALNHFYLDVIYGRFLISPFLLLSKKVAGFDLSFIDYSLNIFGKFIVILAKLIAWFDRKVIDGFVNFMAWLAGLIGKLGRLTQNGKIQSYYVFSVFGLIFLVLYIIFF